MKPTPTMIINWTHANFKMEAIEQVDADIAERLQILIDRGMSYEEISHFLCARHTSITRGLSARSVRRFCASRGIGKKRQN